MSTQHIADFSLPATSEQTFTLSAISNKYVVIYFYPKDNTSGCTTESQQFRDLYSEFQKADCDVVGVSRDSIKSHEGFKEKQSLPFELLSDGDETVCNLFNVIKEKMMYGKPGRGIERSTFILDKTGVIHKEWRKLKADGHAQEVLDFILAHN